MLNPNHGYVYREIPCCKFMGLRCSDVRFLTDPKVRSACFLARVILQVNGVIDGWDL